MKIVLAGSGYLADSMISISSNYNFDKIIEYSRSKKGRVLDNVRHYTKDFDDDNVNFNELKDKASIVYMAPPRQDRNTDTRLDNFLHKIKKLEIEKITYISTSGVYGDYDGNVVDETSPLKPITDRAKRRVSAEKSIISFCKETKNNYIIFRVPGIYGPGRLPIDRILEGEPILKSSDAKVTNLIHVEDLARLTWNSLIDGVVNEIFNVSDGNPTTSTDYYLKICKILNLKSPDQINIEEAKKVFSEKRMSFLNESRILNIDKMNRYFDGQIKYKNLEDGIKASV